MAKPEPLTIHVHGKPVELTSDTIATTWAWFAENARACAREAAAGAFFVNDLPGYLEECERHARDYDAHVGRMSVTFIQRAYFIQTGESVPLLSA